MRNIQYIKGIKNYNYDNYKKTVGYKVNIEAETMQHIRNFKFRRYYTVKSHMIEINLHSLVKIK